MSQIIPFDGDGLNVAFNWSGQVKFVGIALNPNFVDANQPPARLFQSERLVLLDHLKTRPSHSLLGFPVFVVKELLVGFVVAFSQLLYSLASYPFPESKPYGSAQFEQVTLHSGLTDVLASYAIVTALQGNHVIPNDAGNFDLVHQMFVSPVTVQSVLKSFSDLHIKIL
jgi:hypothetical protein